MRENDDVDFGMTAREATRIIHEWLAQQPESSVPKAVCYAIGKVCGAAWNHEEEKEALYDVYPDRYRPKSRH